MHQIFDEPYQTGLGFEFERKMPGKAIMNDNAFRKAIRKRYGLKPVTVDISGSGTGIDGEF